MADNNFSIPEFLKSAEVFADETDGDLSDDFQNAAIPIIGEMENIMLQYGKESVSNLLPLIVQVFENLDSTQKDNRRYLDTINAMSTDSEHLNTQYEEERLKRRQKDSDLIKIEEAYDREIIKLRQELDFQTHQCKQSSAKNKSVGENLLRAEERYDVLISQISLLKTENLHFRQLLQSEQKGRKVSSLFMQGFDAAADLEEAKNLGPPVTFSDFSPNVPRNLNRRSTQKLSISENPDLPENSSDETLSETYSSSSELQSNNREITSSFNSNTFNFRREYRQVSNRKSLGSKVFVFSGVGSVSDQELLNNLPGKKRRKFPENLDSETSVSDNMVSVLSPNETPSFNNARNIHNKDPLLTDIDNCISNQQIQIPQCLSSSQTSGEAHCIERDHTTVGKHSDVESISISTEYSPVLLENLKLQEEINKLLTLKNTFESQANTMQADLEVLQQQINDFREQEKNLTEKNISLEAEVKRLQNTLADDREDHRNETEVFFGFTRTEMAQVLRERDQFKERYFALKREYGALEARRNQKSKIWTFFANIFKRIPPEESIRPVSIILNSQISHKTIEDELDEITRNSTRNLFEEDSGPYDCAVSLQRATFVPFLRKSAQEEDNRIDAYGWTLPRSTLGESFEDSIRSFSSEGSIPSHIAALSCCRPVSPQEEGAKLWCATPVGEVMGNISHYNSSTTAALFWVCWGVPNLTKVSVVDSASTEILETFPVCASPLLAICFVPGISGPSSPLNIDKPTSKLATMWMGGDSGCLYIHSALVAWDKCLYALRLQSSVTDVKYSGGHVFAALTNGTLEIFNRNIQGEWDWDNHRSISIGQRRDFPVLCLLPVNHKIWSGISHTVRILDDTTLKEEHSLQVHYKVTSQVTNMVFYGYGVWLTIRQDSTLRLYNATTYDHLQDLDLAPKLHNLLQLPNNTFPIRITALLVANDSIWIGCDHGAILSIPFSDNTCNHDLGVSQALEEEITTVYPLRSLSLNSNEDSNSTSPKLSSMQSTKHSPFCSIDKFQLSFHGHTGPVRFILSASKTVARSEGFDNIDNQIENLFTATSLIVSGGEGHVDYRTSEGAIVGGPDMPLRHKNSIDPTVVVTDRNYFIVWHAKR